MRWDQRVSELIVFILTGVMLKGPPGAFSATGNAALAVGLSMMATLLVARRVGFGIPKALLLLLTLGVFGVGIAITLFGGGGFGALTGILGRDTTFTGRTEIWSDLMPSFRRYPLVGVGFGGFWTEEKRDLYQVTEAHSGYLQVLLEMGVIGLVLLGVVVMKWMARGAELLKSQPMVGVLTCCFVSMLLVHNITESSMNALSGHLPAVALLLGVVAGGVLGGEIEESPKREADLVGEGSGEEVIK